ncbi:hypothetical protein BDC45DRAFT_571644 [Circinella umbellata]|nr:hypothetical protein BDC45DRAFT_571644 [Circinella umbellata]
MTTNKRLMHSLTQNAQTLEVLWLSLWDEDEDNNVDDDFNFFTVDPWFFNMTIPPKRVSERGVFNLARVQKPGVCCILSKLKTLKIAMFPEQNVWGQVSRVPNNYLLLKKFELLTYWMAKKLTLSFLELVNLDLSGTSTAKFMHFIEASGLPQLMDFYLENSQINDYDIKYLLLNQSISNLQLKEVARCIPTKVKQLFSIHQPPVKLITV